MVEAGVGQLQLEKIFFQNESIENTKRRAQI
jgi:hypothetical protein